MADINRIPARVLDVIRSVAAEHGLSVEDLIGPRRFHKFVQARHEAMWRVRAMVWPCGWGWRRWPSYPQIGRWFNRDHTTVILGVRAWSELVLLSPDDVPVDEAAFIVDRDPNRETMAA